MNKIAFFYNLGYQMMKEAQNPAEKTLFTGTGNLLKAIFGAGRKRVLTPEMIEAFKAKNLPTENLALLESYLPYLKRMWGEAGTGAKALAVGLPTAGLGGAGAGVYAATRKKKSRLEKLLGL